MMHGGRFGGMLNQETLKPRRVSETLARLGRYFAPFWPMLFLALTFVVIATWTQVTTPELLGQATDCFLAPSSVSSFGPPAGLLSEERLSSCWLVTPDPSSLGLTHRLIHALFHLGGYGFPSEPSAPDRLTALGRLILIVIGLYVVGAIMTGFTFFAMAWVGQHVLRALRVEVFEKLHSLSLDYYARHEAGDLMSRITNDTTAIEQGFSFALVNVLSGILLLGWVSYNMLSANLPFGLLALSVSPLMFLATRYFSDQARKAFRQSRERIGDVNAELQETIAAVREIQAFNRVEENLQQFKEINAATRDANVRAVAYTSALAPTLEALSYLGLGIVVGVGGWHLLTGAQLFGTTVTLGLVVTFLAYVQRFNQPIQQIAVLWTNIQNGIAGGERIFQILDERPSVSDRPGAQDMPPIRGRVEFIHVSHEYEPGVPVLKDISFVAEPGQTVAIVGPTGAGKTTIVNLIPRFYDVTAGAVKIDGMDVRDVTLNSLRRQIGMVLQDTFLFSTTVMENVRFGRPDATDEEVIQAIKLAHADTFIERLSEGYQSMLGERGRGLSQGQRQLLSIARAILANPRILILDEATSSVDTRTERLLQDAFDRLMEGRTSFVIAHRLSTVRNADLILVLQNGQIVERGRHEDLLALRGLYYHLYMSQFRRQEEMAVQP